MAAAERSLDVALPGLRLVVPAVSSAVARQIERGLSKFATNTAPSSITLTAQVRCEEASNPARASAVGATANTWYQFVVGCEREDGAVYATADGSVASIAFSTGELTLQLTPDVFDAPYSTWSDLLSAPLAAAWRRHRFFPLHAAAVSFDEATVLVIGASGSGKTTTALALVDGGGCWRADDKVLLHGTGRALRAMSLYANTNLAPATIAAHPSLRFALERPPINGTNDKRPCFLDEFDCRVDLRPFAPGALLFVEQEDCVESRLDRLSETDALLRLSAQSPTGAWRGSMKEQHRHLVAVARTLPAWRLRAGRDVLDRREHFASRVRAQLFAVPACSA